MHEYVIRATRRRGEAARTKDGQRFPFFFLLLQIKRDSARIDAASERCVYSRPRSTQVSQPERDTESTIMNNRGCAALGRARINKIGRERNR